MNPVNPNQSDQSEWKQIFRNQSDLFGLKVRIDQINQIHSDSFGLKVRINPG